MVSLISEIHDDLEKGALRLMTEYRARLFVEAVRLCEDKVEAEDLVSRTFSKAIFNLDSYKEDDNLYGWMKTIMVNIHRNDLARPVARGTTPVSSEPSERLLLRFATEEAKDLGLVPLVHRLTGTAGKRQKRRAVGDDAAAHVHSDWSLSFLVRHSNLIVSNSPRTRAGNLLYFPLSARESFASAP